MEPTWDTDQWVQILTIHLLKIFEVLNLSKLSLKLCFNSVVDSVYQQVEPEPWAPAKKGGSGYALLLLEPVHLTSFGSLH